MKDLIRRFQDYHDHVLTERYLDAYLGDESVIMEMWDREEHPFAYATKPNERGVRLLHWMADVAWEVTCAWHMLILGRTVDEFAEWWFCTYHKVRERV